MFSFMGESFTLPGSGVDGAVKFKPKSLSIAVPGISEFSILGPKAKVGLGSADSVSKCVGSGIEIE